MLRRLSAFFATLALATGLSVAAITPAQATGPACSSINIAGDADASSRFNPATRTYKYGLSLNDLVGSASTSCPYSSYQYELTFSRGGDSGPTTTISSTGSSYAAYTDSTTVTFSDGWIEVPSGNGTLQLTIKTWRYSPQYGFWFSSASDSRVVYVKVPNHFDTWSGRNVSSSSACYPEPGTTITYGYGGWC